MRKKEKSLFQKITFGVTSLAGASLLTGTAPLYVEAADQAIVINEVESSDDNGGADWVELYNNSDVPVDLSGWRILDDKGLERVESGEAWAVPEGTVLEPGAFLVLEEELDFDFGLGKNDAVTLIDRNSETVDHYSWDGLGHATNTYGREVDGLGEFIDLPFVTRGLSNHLTEAPALEEQTGPFIYLNEIESDDPTGGVDWAEIYNYGTDPIDISGWYILDDKGFERLSEGKVFPLAEGTILQPGEYFVFEQDTHFDFGLGKGDTVTVYDSEANIIDEHTYPSRHAMGTFGRLPENLEMWVDLAEATKGTENVSEISQPDDAFVLEPAKGEFLINEVDSNPSDWVEFVNTTNHEIDISGYEFRDDSDDHRFQFAEGTIVPANGLIVVYQGETEGLYYDDVKNEFVPGTFNFGIGSSDEIRLFNPAGELVDQFGWTTGHAAHNGDPALATWGRMPDGNGKFYLTMPTPEMTNVRHQVSISVNEVESSDPYDGPDWVEIYNYGQFAVDISGWHMADEDGALRVLNGETTPVPAGTILNPGEFYVFEEGTDFDFGLGKGDSAILFDEAGQMIDQYTWPDNHANGTYGRIPNGTGEWVDMANPSKGDRNHLGSPVLINEIESKDSNDGPDWVELYNPTNASIDLSGLTLKDNKDDHAYVLPEGTTLEAGAYLVLTEDDFGFGLSGTDSVHLFDGEELIQEFSWESHAKVTYGRRPVADLAFGETSEATPGARNRFADIPLLIEWPGTKEVVTVDDEPFFLEDSSGLDFHDGALYAVDNGTGIFWKLNMDEEGNLTPAEGFENGKRVRFQKDADNSEAAGPDAEGITVDGRGFIYLAVERDNSAKDVNYNVILQVNPEEVGPDIIALNEWDLTASLPQVSANMGIEAIEWVSNADLEGQLFDEHLNTVYDASNYPNAVANGVFFVALEDNGHVYAYILNEDNTVQQIADINSHIGGAMGLDYDTAQKVLWVESDNGYNGVLAQITFNGTAEPGVLHVERPQGLSNDNHEGFAIAGAEFTVDGFRPVFWFRDGYTSGSLTQGWLAFEAAVEETPTDENPLEENPSSEDSNEEETTQPDSNTEEVPTPGTQPEETVQEVENDEDENSEFPETGESTNAATTAIASMTIIVGFSLARYAKKREEVK